MPETRTGAEYVVGALEEYGVEHLFGNPGTTELPVVQAVGDSDIEYVLGLHEDVAVGMASGYARTRRYHSHHDESVTPLGVANLHVAPGLAHGIGNLIGAHFAGAPVLVTAGNHSRDFQHEEPILAGELAPMVDQYTKWSAEVDHVDALPTMLRRAVRQALTPPTGPVFLGLPLDVMLEGTDADVERLGPIPGAGRGDPDDIEHAVDALAAADQPVLVAGDEIARSGSETVEAAVTFAEAIGARVHGDFLPGEVNFPMDHPQWAGTLPGTEAGMAAALETDTVVYVGCGSTTTSVRHEDALVPDDTTVIQVGPDTWELGKNQPADASVIGDPGHVMRELVTALETRIDEDARRSRVEWAADSAGTLREESKPEPGDPDEERLSKDELGRAMADGADDALVVNEGVTSSRAVRWHAEYGPEGTFANKSGGLGYGLPAAVGAAIAERRRPEPRDVVAFIGDGSYYYYPQTIYSAVRRDLGLTVVVANNSNYRILKDNTMRVLGGTEEDHEFTGMDFEPPLDVTKSAESYGATGRVVDASDDAAAAIREAISEDATTVLDVRVHD